MDVWGLISYLCKVVVESQNVYLDILCINGNFEIMLMPMEDNDEID